MQRGKQPHGNRNMVSRCLQQGDAVLGLSLSHYWEFGAGGGDEVEDGDQPCPVCPLCRWHPQSTCTPGRPEASRALISWPPLAYPGGIWKL